MFRVGDVAYTWDDVVERARVCGIWSQLEDDVRGGLAALRELDARGESPDEDDVEAAARSFRYARGLLAGDELDAWLDSRGLTTGGWEDHLRRSLARDLVPDADPAGEDPAAHVWAEGICSGTLERLAHDLATLVAVAPDAAADDRDDVYESFCRAAATDAAIAREIESNRLEWIRLRYDAVVLADEDSAAEAALCVRSDGDALSAVAERIGVDVEERLDWLDEVEPELASRFLAADAGALVGPVAVEDGFLIGHLLAKTSPTADDDDVRERAAEAVGLRAASRAVNDRVVWLEPV